MKNIRCLKLKLLYLLLHLFILSCKKSKNEKALASEDSAKPGLNLTDISPYERLDVQNIDVSDFILEKFTLDGEEFPLIKFPGAIFDYAEVVACYQSPTCDDLEVSIFSNQGVIPLFASGPWYFSARACLFSNRSVTGEKECGAYSAFKQFDMEELSDNTALSLLTWYNVFQKTYSALAEVIYTQTYQAYLDLKSCNGEEEANRLLYILTLGPVYIGYLLWNNPSATNAKSELLLAESTKSYDDLLKKWIEGANAIQTPLAKIMELQLFGEKKVSQNESPKKVEVNVKKFKNNEIANALAKTLNFKRPPPESVKEVVAAEAVVIKRGPASPAMAPNLMAAIMGAKLKDTNAQNRKIKEINLMKPMVRNLLGRNLSLLRKEVAALKNIYEEHEKYKQSDFNTYMKEMKVHLDRALEIQDKTKGLKIFFKDENFTKSIEQMSLKAQTLVGIKNLLANENNNGTIFSQVKSLFDLHAVDSLKIAQIKEIFGDKEVDLLFANLETQYDPSKAELFKKLEEFRAPLRKISAEFKKINTDLVSYNILNKNLSTEKPLYSNFDRYQTAISQAQKSMQSLVGLGKIQPNHPLLLQIEKIKNDYNSTTIQKELEDYSIAEKKERELIKELNKEVDKYRGKNEMEKFRQEATKQLKAEEEIKIDNEHFSSEITARKKNQIDIRIVDVNNRVRELIREEVKKNIRKDLLLDLENARTVRLEKDGFLKSKLPNEAKILEIKTEIDKIKTTIPDLKEINILVEKLSFLAFEKSVSGLKIFQYLDTVKEIDKKLQSMDAPELEKLKKQSAYFLAEYRAKTAMKDFEESLSENFPQFVAKMKTEAANVVKDFDNFLPKMRNLENDYDKALEEVPDEYKILKVKETKIKKLTSEPIIAQEINKVVAQEINKKAVEEQLPSKTSVSLDDAVQDLIPSEKEQTLKEEQLSFEKVHQELLDSPGFDPKRMTKEEQPGLIRQFVAGALNRYLNWSGSNLRIKLGLTESTNNNTCSAQIMQSLSDDIDKILLQETSIAPVRELFKDYLQSEYP